VGIGKSALLPSFAHLVGNIWPSPRSLSNQQPKHQAALDMVGRGDMPGAGLLAYAQCRPSREKMARSQFLSQGRKLMRQMQACVQEKTAALRSVLQLLQGSLEPVQVHQTWFSPKHSNWLQGAGWQAVELPEGDELQELDAMR
jgi:hypothetical protein